MLGKRTRWALLLATLAILPAPSLHAIEQFTEAGFEGGHWDTPNIPVTFRLDTAFATQFPSVDWYGALQSGFHAWEMAPRTNFRFRPNWTISGATVDFDPAVEDGYNVVSPILTSESNYDSGMVGAIGITWTGFKTESTKHFREVDIIMNTKDFTFSTDDPPSADHDVMNILTHEAGHAFCFLDVYEPGWPNWSPWMGQDNGAWTMFGGAYYQETNKRTIDAYDKDGAAYMYPVTDVLASKTPVEKSEVPWSWTYSPTVRYWTAVGVVSSADKDIYLFNDDDLILAASSTGANLEIVVADFNHCASARSFWARAEYGDTEPYIVEACNEPRKLLPGVPITVTVSDPRSLVDMWDVYMQKDRDYAISVTVLSGALDTGTALFSSGSGCFFGALEDAVVAADAGGVGAPENLSYTCGTEDWYGFLVYNKSAAAAGPTGSYVVTLQDLGPVAPVDTPTETPTWDSYPTRTPTPDPGTDIAAALDITTLTFTTGGNTKPVSQDVTFTCDGDAVQTGDIYDYEASYVRSIVQGPTVLTFQWKVSSEANTDWFSVFVDGTRAVSISGEVDWTAAAVTLASGEHTVVWSYDKNPTISSGSDCGWFDCLVYTPLSSTPTRTPTPVGSLAEAVDNYELSFTTDAGQPWLYQTTDTYFGGDAARIQAIRDYTRSSMITTVEGPCIMSFYWKCSTELWYDILWCEVDGNKVNAISGPMDWRQDAVTVLSGGPHEVKWTYEKDTNNFWGQDMGAVDKVVYQRLRSTPTMTPVAVSIPEAVDDLSGNYTTGGDAPFFGLTGLFPYGGDAAQAATILDGQSSWMERAVTGPAVVAFLWKVGSEPGDTLCVAVDGGTPLCITGWTDWAPVSLVVADGNHTVRWTYAKDAAGFKLQDTGWVDQVQVLLMTPTFTATPTSTWTLTRTPTSTPTDTRTATVTASPTSSPTATGTPTWTGTWYTFTHTPTVTPTFTITFTHTFTPTHTVTRTFTSTSTPTFTRTPTMTASQTSSPTATGTPTITPTPTDTPVFAEELALFPNPVTEKTVTLAYNLRYRAGTVTVKIYTVASRLVLKKDLSGAPGVHLEPLDVSSFSNGLLHVVLFIDGRMVRKPLLILR